MMEEASLPRILYVVGQLTRGGAEQQLYYLVKYLRPPAIVVSLSQGGYWVDPIRELGVQVVELEWRGHRSLRRLLTVNRMIRQYKPDIVHAFMDSASGLYTRLGALLAGQRRVVVGERRHPSTYPTWYGLAKRLLNRNGVITVCNSLASRDYLVRHRIVSSERVLVIRNGLELSLFENTGRAAQTQALPVGWEDKYIIGTVGSLRPVKAPDVFLKSAARVLAQRDDVRFVHIGGGQLFRPMLELAQQLGVDGKLILLGERHDVPNLLPLMDIFMLTSHQEGMPNAVMEAMAAGLPCVVTDAGGCRELVEQGRTGFVVPIGDVDAPASRIVQLLDNPDLREIMGRCARERAYREFDVRGMADQYRQLYFQLMNDRNAAMYPIAPNAAR